MSEHSRNALKELQQLDLRIQEARQRILAFDPALAEVEEPALVLAGEVTTTRNRLQEMRQEERRLQLSTEEKRARVKRLDERLSGVRNLREEAAVSAELDMVRRGLQNEEQEVYTLIDQIRKLDGRLAELEAALKQAQAQVEPRMQGLQGERESAQASLATLEARREAFAESMDKREVRLYESIRSGGRRLAVAELTEDGACGHCFGVVPLQLQNEVRHGRGLIRCEACGVILAAPSAPAPHSGGPEAAAPE